MTYKITPLVPGELGENSEGHWGSIPVVPKTLELILDCWPRDDVMEILGLTVVTERLMLAIQERLAEKFIFEKILVKKSEYYDEVSGRSDTPILYFIYNQNSMIWFSQEYSSLLCSDEFMSIIKWFNCYFLEFERISL